MSDDTGQRGPQDRTRININQDHEVRYWTQALGVSEADLCRAVGAVGVSADKVRDYLSRGTATNKGPANTH
jgi:hypothetical protein